MSDEDLTPAEIDNEISDRITFLIENNTRFINTSREMASEVLKQAEVYEALAEVAREIAGLHALGARRIADITGDLISSEWGIVEGEPPEDDVADCR